MHQSPWYLMTASSGKPAPQTSWSNYLKFTKLAGTPDWWGELETVPTGLTEDRYVKSVEVVEVNDVDMTQLAGTVGGRYIFHHMLWFTAKLDEEGNPQRGLFSNPWPGA
ncbi:MAG: hypothetical protein Ct9H300mP22_5710 [Gammaproteobacteria bacterium]|nr:MAG: hypothetical protein Ct9H300mP22_5710 [Gammaproteobacteria bacterium]